MISRENVRPSASNSSSKRKATEEVNDENAETGSAKMIKTNDASSFESGTEERNSPDDDRFDCSFDKSVESEFRTLKSLIPRIAGKAEIGELEIIDACVSYIESLQDQLRAHDPKILDGLTEEGCTGSGEKAEEDEANNNGGGGRRRSCPPAADTLESASPTPAAGSSLHSTSPSPTTSPVRRNSLRENQRLR